MNTQEELIREFREAAEDSIREWCRRWVADSGDSIRVRYMDDGTAEIERETSVGFDRISVNFGVAVVPAEKSNEPYGFILNRAWGEVHVGWFVKTPKGAWIEVVENDEVAGGEQRKVTLLVNGNRATFTYPADRNVSIRKGSKTRAMDDAIKLLSDSFGGASVIQDWS